MPKTWRSCLARSRGALRRGLGWFSAAVDRLGDDAGDREPREAPVERTATAANALSVHPFGIRGGEVWDQMKVPALGAFKNRSRSLSGAHIATTRAFTLIGIGLVRGGRSSSTCDSFVGGLCPRQSYEFGRPGQQKSGAPRACSSTAHASLLCSDERRKTHPRIGSTPTPTSKRLVGIGPRNT